MQNADSKNLLVRFLMNQAGETPNRLALMFAAATIFGTVLFMPFINSATQRIVQNGLGVDSMTTASTGKVKNKYIIRKSVLNQKDKFICLKGRHDKCDESRN